MKKKKENGGKREIVIDICAALASPGKRIVVAYLGRGDEDKIRCRFCRLNPLGPLI